MKPMKTSKSWASALEISLGGESFDIPKDFHDCHWWGKLWGLGNSRTKDLISQHVKSGRMEMKKFKVKGSITSVIPHYRAVK